MSVIRLVDSTCAGLEWNRCPELDGVSARPGWHACVQVRVPPPRPGNGGRPVCREAHRLGPRCARSTRRNGSAGPAQRTPRAWPGRWTTGSPRACWGGIAEDERRARRATCREEVATEASRSPLREPAQSPKSGDAASPRRMPAWLPTGESTLRRRAVRTSSPGSTGASVRTQ
jgi:hypothetical protein